MLGLLNYEVKNALTRILSSGPILWLLLDLFVVKYVPLNTCPTNILILEYVKFLFVFTCRVCTAQSARATSSFMMDELEIALERINIVKHYSVSFYG